MDLVNCIYQILIAPIEAVFAIIFNEVFRLFETYEVAVVGTSIVICLIALPYYKPIGALKLLFNPKTEVKGGTFDNGTYVLPSIISVVISLALQIPFIIASFSFFTSKIIPSGKSWLLFKDITEPDRFILLGQNRMNVLPIVVFFVFILCSILTSRKNILNRLFYALMAAGYLLILYRKPVCLVLFWLIFSLLILIFVLLDRYFHNAYKSFWALLSFTGIGLVVALVLGGAITKYKQKASIYFHSSTLPNSITCLLH